MNIFNFLVSIFLLEHSPTRHFSSPEMTEKVDEFVRSENVLVRMDQRTLKKQRSRLESNSKAEAEAPKYQYAPPPPPLPPPPTPAANLPIKVRRAGEQPLAERPTEEWSDWTEEIKQRKTTLR